MSIYQKPEVLEQKLGYDIITFKVSGNGNINLKAGDKLINGRHSYKISSAASFALANGECPIETYNNCVAAGDNAYWIMALGTTLINHVQEQRIKVDIGQKVNFEGRIFEITKEPNHNLGLKPVEITENNRCIAVNA